MIKSLAATIISLTICVLAGCSKSKIEQFGQIGPKSELRIHGENLRHVAINVAEYYDVTENSTSASNSYGDWRLRAGKPVIHTVDSDVVGLSVTVYAPFGKGAHVELYSDGKLVSAAHSSDQETVIVLEAGTLPVDRKAEFAPYRMAENAVATCEHLLEVLKSGEISELNATSAFKTNSSSHLKDFLQQMTSKHGELDTADGGWISGDRDPSFILTGTIRFGEFSCPLFVGCTPDGKIDIVQFQPKENHEFIQLEAGWLKNLSKESKSASIPSPSS